MACQQQPAACVANAPPQWLNVGFQMNEHDIASLIDEQISNIADESVRDGLRKLLIPVRVQTRTYGWESEIEEYRLWIVADMQIRNVGIAFAEGGFAKQGLPWGLVFLDEQGSGGSENWYATLEECIVDSGYL